MLSRAFFKKIAVLLLWLIVWQISAMVVNQQILIPTPLETLKALFGLAKTERFYFSVLISLLRIVVGFILGVLVGTIGALLSVKFKLFDDIFSPILKIIRAVPVASFIILALVWFHSNTLPIFITFLMVLPMIWSTVQNGFLNLDKRYLELAEVYRLEPSHVFFQIKLPLIFPEFIATSLTALGFAWKSGVAAEVICRPHNSLGALLQESKLYIATPEVFALTAVVALLSLALEVIIKKALRRYTNDNP